MHGGAKGSGAPTGPANGNYRHGGFTCDAARERRTAQELIQQTKNMLKEIG